MDNGPVIGFIGRLEPRKGPLDLVNAAAAIRARAFGARVVIPVVATRVDGLREVVANGVTGRLVTPGDPAALARAVVEVLSWRREMGSAPRVHARRFNADGYVAHVERLIAA